MNVIEHTAPVSRAPRGTPNRTRIRERLLVIGVALVAALVVVTLSGIAAGGETKTVRPRQWPATANERRIQAEAIADRDAALNRYWSSIQTWVNGVVANQQREAAAARARELAAQTAAHQHSVRSSGGGCNGLEACRACVTSRESATAGLYNAYNPSGAAGRYQVMPDTWGGFGGYASAKDAPPAVQDEWFNQAYSRYHGQAGWSQLYTDGC